MKIINSKTHAVLDYLMVMILLVSPNLFQLGHNASLLCYTLGIVHFLLTICTDFSAGIFKLIKLKLHGLIELTVSILLMVLAFTVFGDNLNEEIYFACLSLLILFIFLLTDYNKKPSIVRKKSHP